MTDLQDVSSVEIDAIVDSPGQHAVTLDGLPVLAHPRVAVADAATVPTVPMLEALDAVEAAVGGVVDLLRRGGDGFRRVPRLTWTAGETAAHLVDRARIFEDMAWDVPREETQVSFDQISSVNWRGITSVGAADLAQLAGELEGAVARGVQGFATLDPSRMVPTVAGFSLLAPTVVAMFLGELLVHGHDLGRSLGHRQRIDPDHARLVLVAAAAVAPRRVNRRRAHKLSATYDMEVRGGSRFLYRFDRGTLTVTPWTPGSRSDCHISADPVAMLLCGYGRINWIRPALRGQLRSWGRRPWLGSRYQSLLLRP